MPLTSSFGIRTNKLTTNKSVEMCTNAVGFISFVFLNIVALKNFSFAVVEGMQSISGKLTLIFVKIKTSYRGNWEKNDRDLNFASLVW